MKTKTILILGAAALYFYGPKLANRISDEANDALDEVEYTVKSSARKVKNAVQSLPDIAGELDDMPPEVMNEGDMDTGSFEERAANAHISRRNGKVSAGVL